MHTTDVKVCFFTVLSPGSSNLKILVLGDVPRVNGQLAVARAFGDQNLKAHLSSEPDIRHVPIDSTIEFVILASDGLWKVGFLNTIQNI